jgi:hypothetical protein
MIEIEDGFFVDPFAVTVVKAAGKKKCVLYVIGQSALDGFVLERNALEAAQEILDARAGVEEENDDEDDEE